MNIQNFESNRIVTSVFDSIRNEHNYSKFSNTYRHRFLTYLTEWRRFFTLATMPSNQQNLLLTMVQVLYLLEVFIGLLAHYGPPSTETPTTTIVWCHKNSWIYLTSTYLLLVTFQTNDNYSISFDISNNTRLFDSIRNEKNTIRTALQIEPPVSNLNGRNPPTTQWARGERYHGIAGISRAIFFVRHGASKPLAQFFPRIPPITVSG